MAATTTTTTTRIIKRADKELSQTKIVLRHLPPDMTKDSLLEALHPLPPHLNFYFVPATSSNGYSRAYFNFENDNEAIRSFRDNYDGIQLQNEKGSKYRAIVEFAPYQGISHPKAKPDTRCGTILEDPDYISFLEQYETKVEALASLDVTYLDTLEKTPEVQPTPLSEFLRDKKLSRRGAGGRKVTYIINEKKRKKPKVIEVKTKEGSGSKSSAKTPSNDVVDVKEKSKEKKQVQHQNEKKEKPVIIVHEKMNGKERSKYKSSSRVDSSGGVKNKDRQDQQLYSPKGRRGSDRGNDRGSDKSERSDKSDRSERGSDRGERGSDRGNDRGSDQSRANDKRRSPYYKNDGHYHHSSSSYSKPKSSSGYRNSRHDNHQYQFLEEKDDYQGPDAGTGWGTRQDDHGSRYRGSNRRSYEQEHRGGNRTSHYK